MGITAIDVLLEGMSYMALLVVLVLMGVYSYMFLRLCYLVLKDIIERSSELRGWGGGATNTSYLQQRARNLTGGVVVTLSIPYESVTDVDVHTRKQGFDKINLKHQTYTSSRRGTNSNDHCSICLDKFKEGEEVGVLHCKHEFHSCCISHWLLGNSTCPNCRQHVRLPV